MKKPSVILSEDAQSTLKVKTAIPQEKMDSIVLATSDSVSLPSNFVFYDFKDLYITPFKTKHLSKLVRIQNTTSPSHLAEVVDSVLSTSSGETGLAFKLTHEDYNWVLYWLRFNSFNKSKYTIKTKCHNPEHIAKVKSGEWDKKTLNITTVVETSVLNTECTYLPEDFKLDWQENVPQDIKLPDGFYLGPVCYQDIIDMTDDPLMKVTYNDPETGKEVADINPGYMYQAAPALLMHWPGATWKERYDLAGELSGDDYQRVVDLGKKIPKYGVKETIEVKCGRCGAKRKVLAYIDAHSFFPGA